MKIKKVERLTEINDMLKRGLLEDGDSVEEHCCTEYKQKLLTENEQLRKQIADHDDSLTVAYMQGVEDGKAKNTKSATGPWRYDDPPTDEQKLLIQFPAEYITDQVTCVIHWNESSELIYGKPMCWAEIHMPEGWEE